MSIRVTFVRVLTFDHTKKKNPKNFIEELFLIMHLSVIQYFIDHMDGVDEHQKYLEITSKVTISSSNIISSSRKISCTKNTRKQDA